MEKNTRILFLFLSIMFFNAYGTTPVHVGKLNIDTSLYDFSYSRGTFRKFIKGPLIEYPVWEGAIAAYLKKNSNQFDIYTLSGKIGTTVVPIFPFSNEYVSISNIAYSCYMLDDDDEWETLVNLRDDESSEEFFKVFDNDGTELLAGSGFAAYGCDGYNTYVLVKVFASNDLLNYDIWRFRTNITTSTPKSLSKAKAAQPPSMQIYGLSDGNYKVSLIPSSGNQVQFQMFDLMGRCIFSKQLENLKTPVTFTIPESNVPNSPFIAKVKDGNETLYKKQIPLR